MHIAVGWLVLVSWLVNDVLFSWELGLVAMGWQLWVPLLVNDVLFRLEFWLLFEMDLVLVSSLVIVGLVKLDRRVAGAGWRM